MERDYSQYSLNPFYPKIYRDSGRSFEVLNFIVANEYSQAFGLCPDFGPNTQKKYMVGINIFCSTILSFYVVIVTMSISASTVPKLV